MAIAVDQNYDKAQRKISTANLKQFAGVDCQLLVEKETHRPIIMDGATVGGKFKCASTDEVKAVETVANNAISQASADARYLGKTEKAVSAGTADVAGTAYNVQWGGVGGVPDNIKNALSFIAQSLTPMQKAQVMHNLAGTFLPLSGGTVTGQIVTEHAQAFTKNRDDSVQTILGASSFSTGAWLALFGNNSIDQRAGGFVLTNGNNISLSGLINNSLTWNGKEVERVNSIGGNYIRYENGLQICWGNSVIPLGKLSREVLLPVPYSTTYFAPSVMYTDVAKGYTVITTATLKNQNNKFTVMCAAIDGRYDWDRYLIWSTVGRWK